MTKEQQSKMLFDEGLALKRAGMYSQAIEKYKKSVLVYTDDPEIMMAYEAIGKAQYLNGNYDAAVAAYYVFVGLCVLKNWEILDDYKKAVNGDEMAAVRLGGSFRNIARHIAHASFDEESKRMGKSFEVEHYTKSLQGKNPAYSDSAESYDNEMASRGLNVLEMWFANFTKNYEGEKKKTIELMRYIVNS